MFEYEINNGEVLITGSDDESVTYIHIPEFIDGYPVFDWYYPRM